MIISLVVFFLRSLMSRNSFLPEINDFSGTIALREGELALDIGDQHGDFALLTGKRDIVTFPLPIP